MKKVWIAMAVIAALVLLLLIASFTIRNGLIGKEESVKEQWSQIDTQLQRRSDLIPNLVSTVKGYAAHEEKIFAEVSAARAKMMASVNPAEKAAAGADLNQALGRLIAVAESYPQLKASENFVRLQDELAGTENRIAVARTRYNKAVREYNAAIRQFPGSLFVEGLGLERADFFDPPAGHAAVERAPEVNFK